MDENMLWKNQPGSPLLVIIPGGTGSHRPGSRGSDVIAGHFWQCGYSCYVSETAGQDGRTGRFSLENSLRESRDSVDLLATILAPKEIYFLASCSGGAVAVWLAAETALTKSIVLWESPARFSAASTTQFVQRATAKGMALSSSFDTEIFHLNEKSGQVGCPVALGYGTCDGLAFTQSDLAEMRETFNNSGRALAEISIAGADHSLTRGSNAVLLNAFLSKASAFMASCAI